MAATTDIRYQRVESEYQAVRKAQDQVLDRVDAYEAALLGLSETVAENSRMLRAIIEHLQIPYNKPPMGFQKDQP